MTILESSPVAGPDTFGLPEYRISEMTLEIDGTDVRMAFGAKRFGQIQWLYTVVCSPKNLLAFCQAAELAAIEALNYADVWHLHIGSH